MAVRDIKTWAGGWPVGVGVLAPNSAGRPARRPAAQGRRRAERRGPRSGRLLRPAGASPPVSRQGVAQWRERTPSCTSAVTARKARWVLALGGSRLVRSAADDFAPAGGRAGGDGLVSIKATSSEGGRGASRIEGGGGAGRDLDDGEQHVGVGHRVAHLRHQPAPVPPPGPSAAQQARRGLPPPAAGMRATVAQQTMPLSRDRLGHAEAPRRAQRRRGDGTHARRPPRLRRTMHKTPPAAVGGAPLRVRGRPSAACEGPHGPQTVTVRLLYGGRSLSYVVTVGGERGVAEVWPGGGPLSGVCGHGHALSRGACRRDSDDVRTRAARAAHATPARGPVSPRTPPLH